MFMCNVKQINYKYTKYEVIISYFAITVCEH